MKKVFYIPILICGLLLSACSTINSSSQHATIKARARYGVTPFVNNTDVPQAGLRAMSMSMRMFNAKGIRRLLAYKSATTCNQLIACPNASPSLSTLYAWGEREHLDYIISGSVNEWEYKVGLDGEPAVSLTIEIYDVHQRQLVWSAVGSKFGTSRSGLGNTAQALIENMIKTVQIG